MTFPTKGYSVSMQFPANKNSKAVIKNLNKAVIDHDGRVSLACDNFLDSRSFRKIYVGVDQWLDGVKALDGDNRFRSLLSDNVDIKKQA